MFKIGDKIVYPLHGAGTITGIETKKVLGSIHKYFVLQIPIGDMKVMIPTDNIEEIGIREISSEKEADEIIEFFKTYSGDEYESNWNRRYQDNIKRLREGSLIEVAKIAKSLLLRDREKALSNAERKMLSNSKHILISELVIAKKTSQKELEIILFE